MTNKKYINKTLHYFGLLGNVNRSIRRINFHKDFAIEEWTKESIVKFLIKIGEFDSSIEAENFYEDQYDYDWEEKETGYVLTGTFSLQMEQHVNILDNASEEMSQQDELLQSLTQTIQERLDILKLCSQGDIKLAISCCYEPVEELHYNCLSYRYHTNNFRNICFNIREEEALEYNDFISKVSIPLSHDYLQLAFENFILSYKVDNDSLSFLCLMIALETLFNDGNQELSYRIARGCAVLLGKTVKQSQYIFQKVKKLYNKRSNLVHSGVLKNFDSLERLSLERYVRNSLYSLIDCNFSKKQLSDTLLTEGFGASNRIKKKSESNFYKKYIQN